MYNPREDDNLGTLAVRSSRYSLSDDGMRVRDGGGYTIYEWDEKFPGHESYHRAISDTWVAMTEELRAQGAAVILPIYKYEHGMVALSTESFIGRAHHAEWDSGLCGHIWVSKEKLRYEYGCKRITQKVIETATTVLKDEVEEYSDWLNDGEEE